jgi:hypothetical protein
MKLIKINENLFYNMDFEDNKDEKKVLFKIDRKVYDEAKEHSKLIKTYQNDFNAYVFSVGLEFYKLKRSYLKEGKDEEFVDKLENLLDLD